MEGQSEFSRDLEDHQLLATMVAERIRALCALPYAELDAWPSESATDITIDGRSGAITVITEEDEIDGLLVVVHGFVERASPRLFSPTVVALEGFHKYRDQSVTPMSDSELARWD